ncbi:MAG: bifunctional diguanylate cyclase/phosphodiesterase, partial [Bacilli bacterium]
MEKILFLIIIILLFTVMSLYSIIIKAKHKTKIINRDILTGLNNMYYLKNNFKDYILKNKDVLLLLIDFRQLKYINDNHGHESGDKCLILFSNYIKKYFANSLLIRRSGDEFIIVTSNNISNLKKLLYKVENEISLSYQKNNIPVLFKFNIGITKVSDSNLLNKYLEEADIAMYEAKSKEQLFRVYDRNLHQQIKEEEELIINIEKALNNKEIYYEFEPTYKDNKNILNIECLLRFKNKRKIYEESILKVLKKSYLLEKIDLYTIEYIFNLLSDNNDIIKDSSFSINISPQTLLSKTVDLINEIKELLIKYDISTKNIYFELSENIVIEDIDIIKHKLELLKDMGFNITLDNFGDKYTSLIHLSLFPVNQIKISKSLLIKAMNNEKNEKILQAITKLAKDLKIMIIFSQIESKEEVSYIKKLDKNIGISGFYYNKPMSFVQLTKEINKS